MNWDRLKQAILAIVEAATRNYQYHGKYPAKVISQNGDGTLDLESTFPAMPGLSAIKLKLGLPGTKVEVESGTEVMLAFEGGDPSRPYAELFENSKLKTLEIRCSEKYKIVGPEGELFENGIPIARQGDMVAIGGLDPKVPLPAPPIMWPAFIQMPPGPNVASVVPCLIRFGPKPVYGVIASGRIKLKG